MSNSSKERALHADAASLRKKLEKADQSITLEEDSKQDTHHLKKKFKEELKSKIPMIMQIALCLLAALCILFTATLAWYLFLIHKDPDKLGALLLGTLNIVGAYVFGVLTPALFKNKAGT